MKYICLQLSKCDCGFACLKMLLSHYHKQNSYLYLETDLTKHENLSFYDLKSLAAKNGLF